MKTYWINTYGCQMNAHESERLAHMLEMHGFVQAVSKEQTDILIFQTCCIRDTAERKIITHINQAKKQRKQVPSQKQIIAVIGCLSAHKKIQGVDICLGTNELEKLTEFLCNKKQQPRFGAGNSIIINHGCENFCSYCIVPYVRGREYSRDIDEIVTEFNQIKDCGKTIYLLGQNVNSYKCPRTGTNFTGLLDQLCSHKGNFQLNFLSSHPKDFNSELIECIARSPKIERNIHLPLQSGCDKILAAMNRKYTVKEYLSKIDLLRKSIPNVHITTDIICGFPSETEDDFNQTIETMKKIKFDAAFIFPYSRRSGTVADSLPNHHDQATKKQRATELIKIQREISNQMISKS